MTNVCCSYKVVFDVKTFPAFGMNLLVGEVRKLSLRHGPLTSLLSLDKTDYTDYLRNEDVTKRFATAMYGIINLENSKLKIQIMVGQSAVELFTDSVKGVMSAVTCPTEAQKRIHFLRSNASVNAQSLRALQLKSLQSKQ